MSSDDITNSCTEVIYSSESFSGSETYDDSSSLSDEDSSCSSGRKNIDKMINKFILGNTGGSDDEGDSLEHSSDDLECSEEEDSDSELGVISSMLGFGKKKKSNSRSTKRTTKPKPVVVNDQVKRNIARQRQQQDQQEQQERQEQQKKEEKREEKHEENRPKKKIFKIRG